MSPDVSNEMLPNAAKCQEYSCYRFWVFKEKPTGGKITPVHPEIPKIHKKAPMPLLYRRVYGDFEPYTSVTPSQTCGEVIWKTENDMGVQLFKLVIILYA